MTEPHDQRRVNKSDAANGLEAICRVSNVLRSPSPEPRGSPKPIEPLAMQYLVTKQLLALHDKYDGDLGLLDECWADKRDRELFSAEQMRTLGVYLQQLALSGEDCLAPEFRKEVERRIDELELLVDPDVVSTLRDRKSHSNPKR